MKWTLIDKFTLQKEQFVDQQIKVGYIIFDCTVSSDIFAKFAPTFIITKPTDTQRILKGHREGKRHWAIYNEQLET